MMKFTKKSQTILCITILLILTCISVALVAQHNQKQTVWRDKHPLSDSKVGFQYLYPTKLPSGFSIKSQRISLSHSKPHQLSSLAVEMNLRTSDWVYSIQESKYTNEDLTVKTDDYDSSSIEHTCKDTKTQNNRTYKVCHWVDYKKINVFQVEFVQGNTLVDTKFPTPLDRTLTTEDFDTFINSFVSRKVPELPILADAI
jgi:hypothetical protein